MRNWALKSIALTSLATTVIAAPNHSVWVNDTLFAQTPDTVLILRVVTDNQASYYNTLTDTYLLTLSRADGAVLNIDPVERVAEITGLDPELDGIEFYTLDDAINPYDVRESIDAAPLADPVSTPFRMPVFDAAGLQIIGDGTVSHRLDIAALTTQLERSLARTRATLPIIGESASLSVFEIGLKNLLADCVADLTTPNWFTRGDDTASVMIRLMCDHDEEAPISTYWVVVPSAL